ncbi:MAG: RagB/SusD family nutrient uptake outer membrane protein [Bacteroidales bacterium]|nr:RagB/SusD family nutrient uptake outer membrane protein [Bacteroidales bacterium]
MKKLIYISLLLLAAVSCQKQLKEVVYSNLTDENAFTTAENAQAAVNSLYSSLHLTYREPMFYINDISTDGGYKGDSYFESMNDVAIYNDNRILVAWNGFFEIVTRANIVIDQVPEMADNLFAGGVTKEQLLGEAYFMRAFAYYNLTDVFFQVPLVTSSKIDPTAREPYAPLAKIETLIENDLFNACDYLPKSYASNKDAGRPSYGAAHGYLARLYMRQAGRARQNAEDASGLWKDALNEVNKVLALEGSVYSLQPTVWNVFDPTSEAGIYNNELIFAIRASGNDLPSGSWDLGLQFTGWNYDMGWGNMYQPLEMTWQFDPADERLTVLQVTEYEDVYSPDETYYRAPSNLAETGAVNKNHTVNGKTYVLMNELAETYTQKYKFLNTWKYIYDTPNNLPLMRLSDMILCKAEILNEISGPTQEAIDLINRVRDRAFQDSAHGLSLASYAGKEDLRSAICDERLFELNMECQRRPDLIRMGLWKDRMTKYINTIKQRYVQKAANEGQEAGYYDPAWAAYPDVATLTDDDIRRYMPVPYREVTLNPSLKDARTLKTE